MSDFSKHKVSELKAELSSRGLSQTGTKSKLLERLLQSVEDEKLIADTDDASEPEKEAETTEVVTEEAAVEPAVTEETLGVDADVKVDEAAAPTGSDSAGVSATQAAAARTSIEAKKARMARFGISDATVEKHELELKIVERQKRFVMESLTPAQRARAERFGIDLATFAAPAAVANKPASKPVVEKQGETNGKMGRRRSGGKRQQSGGNGGGNGGAAKAGMPKKARLTPAQQAKFEARKKRFAQ